MTALIVLNGLTYLAVAGLCFFIYFSFARKIGLVKRVGVLVGFNGVFYFLIGVLHFLWLINVFEPRGPDFMVVLTALTVMTSIILPYIAHQITGNKNLIYLFLLYLTALFAINVGLNAFFVTTMFISHLLLIIAFLELLRLSTVDFKWASVTGILFSVSSLAVTAFTLLGKEPQNLYWFIPTIVGGGLFLRLYYGFKEGIAIVSEDEQHGEKRVPFPLTLMFLKFIVFVTSFSAFVLLSTVAIHEVGHAMVAQYYGCERSKAVIYDIMDSPHTEIVCSTYYNDTALTFAGLLATIIVGIIFLITGNRFTTLIAQLIIGFGLFISYGDLETIGVSRNVRVLVGLVGLITTIAAVVKISGFYMKQKRFGKTKETQISLKPEHYFRLNNGGVVKDLYELAQSLHTMDEQTFLYHVNEGRNDFSAWVRDVYNDEDLAQELLRTTDKQKSRSLILTRLLELH